MINKSLEVVFHDPLRNRQDKYDFGRFDLDVETGESLAGAFSIVTGAYLVSSRRQAWRSIMKFIRFLSERNRLQSVSSDKDLLIDFLGYLKREKNLNKTIGSHFNFARRIMVWLSENSDLDLWKGQNLSRVAIPREDIRYRSNDVSSEDIKKIVRICKKEIQEIRSRFSVRNKVESGDSNLVQGLSSQELKALKVLIQSEQKGLWTQRDLQRSGLNHMPLRKLVRYRELTYPDLIPIYLLILIQTAANPLSLMFLSVTCLEDHPVDDDKCVMSWGKPRASREQSKIFLRGGKYGAPELVRLLTEMTSSVRELAPSEDKGILMVIRKGDLVERVSVQSMHNSLKKFRDDNSLSKFTFADIRKAVAGIALKDTGSIVEVASLLQHKDVRTTELYLQSREAKESKYEMLHAFQGRMLEKVELDYPSGQETVLGFNCSDPDSGVAVGSTQGQPCMQYLSCATCPNAIVVKDDPRIVARIYRARDAILEFKRRASMSSDLQIRYENLYQPILRIIEEDIIKKVAASVAKEAEKIQKNTPMIPALY